MLLAGDVGGTKTVLALVEPTTVGTLICKQEQTFASADFDSFEEILDRFLAGQPRIDSACFGIAGPVVEQICKTTNLPWLIDGHALKQRLQTQAVWLLNDLEAMALGMLHLDADDFVELNPNARSAIGNKAVIAAGTGLGEAILYWNGSDYLPIATEGGHSDFAAQTVQQDQLVNFLRTRYPGHVSYERILSGMGFSNLYDFLIETGFAPPCPAVPETNSVLIDRNAIISRLGLSGEDAACMEVVRLFARIYGAEAGNLALKCLATGGVYMGGGIGPKIRPILESGEFMQGFICKGRYQDFMGTLSVKLALNPRTPLIGAMHYYKAR